MINGILLDGTFYRVWITAGKDDLQRSFSFLDGGQGGMMQSGLETLDTIGTSYIYAFTVEPDVRHPEDYDAFFYAVSSPQRIHVITLPFGQTSAEFQCRIDGGSDSMTTMARRTGWPHIWRHLSVTVTPIRPQRTPETEEEDDE